MLAQAQYSFDTRFESGIGTNTEELVAATYTGCISMALSVQQGNAELNSGGKTGYSRRNEQKKGAAMMNNSDGMAGGWVEQWAGGEMWVWVLIGLVMLAVVIVRLTNT